MKKAAHKMGYRISRVIDETPLFPADFMALYAKTKPFTMTSRERQFALHLATRYVVEQKIPGDFVECGVWRGGSSMMAAHTLRELGATDRKIYLYDTFAGMSAPTEHDVNLHGSQADALWNQRQSGAVNTWCYASLEDVRANMGSVGYPSDKLVYVQGKVEDTIPGTLPEQIALLRLDTDFYESTAHELEHLFPRLSKLGILILDDYGHWKGARKATDAYFEKHGLKVFLSPIDYSGRIMVKFD